MPQRFLLNLVEMWVLYIMSYTWSLLYMYDIDDNVLFSVLKDSFQLFMAIYMYM